MDRFTRNGIEKTLAAIELPECLSLEWRWEFLCLTLAMVYAKEGREIHHCTPEDEIELRGGPYLERVIEDMARRLLFPRSQATDASVTRLAADSS